MQRLHYYYGYGGLIPFVGLGIAASLKPTDPFFLSALISYAALIYSFIGGIYWHTSLTQLSPNRDSKSLDYKQKSKINWTLTISVVLMLWSWTWLLADQLISLEVIALSFLLLPVIEHKLLYKLFEREFRTMRTILSITVAATLFAVSLVERFASV